jgi:SAM-dependent methyltransferase
MSETLSAKRSAHQIPAEEWAGAMGDKWLANVDRFEGMIAPAGEALMAHAAYRSGERVVDVGCGGGATTIEIARAVGPDGEVLGLDIAPMLTAEGERRARAAGLANIRFLTADAATARPDGAPFDRLFSRFGSMFFGDPPAAFANLRAMLRSGGRADLGVWASPKENRWVADMMEIAGRYLELPAPVPHAPGPFALDDPDYVRPLLAGAGFERIEITLWRGEQLIGGAGTDAQSAAAFAFEALPIGDAFADKPPELREKAIGELTNLFAAAETPAGVRMEAAAWLVTGYAP